MNAAQHAKYIRCWIRCVRANNWVMRKGRLVDNAKRADASIFHQAVWRAAESLAVQQVRAVTVEDLRHGCHVAALGRDKSSKDMTSGELDRLLLLWGNEREINGLLVYPDDIKAQIHWNDPERARKESLVFAIKACASHEYICSITRDIWGTIYWEDLDEKALRGLLRKLKGNMPAMAGQPY